MADRSRADYGSLPSVPLGPVNSNGMDSDSLPARTSEQTGLDCCLLPTGDTHTDSMNQHKRSKSCAKLRIIIFAGHSSHTLGIV